MQTKIVKGRAQTSIVYGQQTLRPVCDFRITAYPEFENVDELQAELDRMAESMLAKRSSQLSDFLEDLQAENQKSPELLEAERELEQMQARVAELQRADAKRIGI